MKVPTGYVLQESDYPEVPPKPGQLGRWKRYTDPIVQDITIHAEYGNPIPGAPTDPPSLMSTGEEPYSSGTAQPISTVTEEHSYIYASGMLLRETITSGSTTKTLDFRYDNVGYPYALIYNNGSTTATYYYITNLQGDVMYLVDSNGNQVAAYTYDPYGKILSATGAMAEINPLRYRGYYYDSETGFYYLQSRYYDPNTCRFINADGYASTGQDYVGQNMFSYCNNNPTLFSDPMGYSPFESIGAWIANAVEDAREWIEDTVPVVWEKTKRVAESVWNNLDLTFGVGAGLYGQFEIADMGFEAGGYGNVLSIHLSEGEFDVGQDLYLGITGGIVREIGTSNYAFLKDGNIVYEDRWSWINSEQETIGIFSSSLYLLFAGYTFSVEFNLNEFLKDIDEIF